jgi:hypothetical protein
LERRAGEQRNRLWSPEQAGDPDPVEFAFSLGRIDYVIEHTGIEPFAGHIHLSAQAKTHIQPIIDQVAHRLPAGDHFELQLPVGALRDLDRRSLKLAQHALAEFVVEVAPSVKAVPFGRTSSRFGIHTTAGVPFAFSVQRATPRGKLPAFSISHVVDGSLEDQREARIAAACAKKFPKLVAWKAKAGARTVLVLENNDIQLTNEDLVWQALEKVEQDFADRPDEVWLVMTLTDDLWWCVPIRIDGRAYYTTAVEDRWPECDPSTLDDLSMLLRHRA